jgi:hypothetical protein
LQNKHRKKPARSRQKAQLGTWFILREDGGDMFPRNVCRLSTDYTVLYPSRSIVSQPTTLPRAGVSQDERSIFWEVKISAIASKKKTCICTCVLFRTVSEIELISLYSTVLYCTLYRRATRHVLTRVAKCIDVDGGMFENVFNYVHCGKYVKQCIQL